MIKNVDGVLKQWDELYSAKGGGKAKLDKEQLRPIRTRSSRAGSADSARTALRAIAKKTPQAVIKITGGGKTVGAISAHLRYIGRNGELPLEDQDGREHDGKVARADIIERWEATGLPAESKYKEAVNIVLSSPKGADASSVLKAAREFAKEHFGEQHDYAMALHCPENDPSAKKSENAHVHLVVKARGRDGKKLNPRKADLFAWRQDYARVLRANGIDVIAVRREAVFNTKHKGQQQGVYHMAKRGALGPKKTQPEALKKALAGEAMARELYGDMVAALAASKVAGDRELADSLTKVIPAQSVPTRGVPTPRGRSR